MPHPIKVRSKELKKLALSFSSLTLVLGFSTTSAFADPSTYTFEHEPWIVTTPAQPSGIFNGATTAYGVDLKGVGAMFLDTNPTPGLGALCTSALLWTGNHVLTAAHCVTDSSGNISVLDGADGNSITFDTGSGLVTRSFDSTDITVHPNYDGILTNGFDLAIITLDSAVDSSVTRYNINRDTNADLNVTHVKAGYGTNGQGSTGATGGFDGNRRAIQNEWESTGLGSLGVGGINNNSTQLTFDFDNGLAANDAFAFFFGGGFSDTGLGNDEGNSAPGDSGGPTFIEDNGEWVIAGVTSYGLRLSAGTLTSDINAGTSPDSTFGEFSVDARVADAQMLAFIDSVVPEPSSFLLFAAGGFVIVGRRRRAA